MPELPEVETVAAGLRPNLVSCRVVRVDLHFPTIVHHPEPEQFIDGVTGRVVEALTRRGKYLLFHLQGGRAGGRASPGLPEGGSPPHSTDGYLMVIHLGMTGHLQLFDPEAPLAPHVHATFLLDDGRQLRYRDVRRFGRLLFGTEEELLAHRAIPRLGPEPIDESFTASDLYRRLHARRAPLKALLLDQAVLAGVGNIYADESCFRARVRPDRPGSSLSRQAVKRLREALQESLTTAIANRGSSVDSYRDAFGERGVQQERLLVYGRGGQPCPTCGRPLANIRLAGRTTVFCRRCQR